MDARKPRELTIRGLILGALITTVFTAANVYLGLKVGLTFASSIPAAVISMAILSVVRDSSILENNIVQTARATDNKDLSFWEHWLQVWALFSTVRDSGRPPLNVVTRGCYRYQGVQQWPSATAHGTESSIAPPQLDETILPLRSVFVSWLQTPTTHRSPPNP